MKKLRAALQKVKGYKFKDELKKDFKDIKKENGYIGFLEPYNPTKKIYIQTDASHSRLGYVLYQMDEDNSENILTNEEEPATKTSD